MTEGPPQRQKVPTDLVQIPIIWRYELLRYFRSKRLIASIAIAVIVIGLIYIIPPAFGSPYTGSETDEPVTTDELGLPPGILPYHSVGTLSHAGVDIDYVTISVNQTSVPRGSTTWTITDSGLAGGEFGIPKGTAVILFTMNVTGSNVTASYDWSTPAGDFEGAFLSFASILIIIAATFFGADAIVGEYQNRTGYLMFPNPVKRETLFFGKFAASMTAAIFVVVIFYASVILLSVFTVGAIDDDIGLSFAFALAYTTVAMAVAYLISSILKGTTGATVLTFFLFVMILPIVDGVSMVAGVKLEGSVTFAAGVIQYILSDPYPVDATMDVGGGYTIHSYYPDPAIAALTMLIYAAVSIVLSLILFKRKQLAG
jgi:ABC-2 type transport system permease protein